MDDQAPSDAGLAGDGANGNGSKSRRHRRIVPQFQLADTAQQIVGGFLLAGPFVVTEEVWVLATNMSTAKGLFVTGLVFAIGYGALYEADPDRDPDREAEINGIPTRFLSLMLVSFGAVTILALVFGAPETFLEDIPPDRRLLTTLKAIGIGAIFSVVGAATADSVF